MSGSKRDLIDYRIERADILPLLPQTEEFIDVIKCLINKN